MKKIYILLFIVSILTAFCTADKYAPIEVMTLNMRYDNPHDGPNAWTFRAERIAETIELSDVDILSAQELLHNQLVDLRNLLPDYIPIGVGRDDGRTAGEYAPLFILKTRFKVLRSGHFWISPTPDTPGSIGWDAACPRIATWAVLRDKRTNRDIFVINAHLDNAGTLARTNGINLLLTKSKQLSNGLPIILTGDFNTPDTPRLIHNAVSSSDTAVTLYNTRTQARQTAGPDWTFHDFGQLPEDRRPTLDYIFVSHEFNTLDNCTIVDHEGNPISDHAAVLASIELTN